MSFSLFSFLSFSFSFSFSSHSSFFFLSSARVTEKGEERKKKRRRRRKKKKRKIFKWVSFVNQNDAKPCPCGKPHQCHIGSEGVVMIWDLDDTL